MTLPELEWQLIYGRLAWAVVLAALLASLLPATWRSARAAIGLLIGTAALMALPGGLSPAYSLVLVFQYPSAVLVGCCLLRLAAAVPSAPRIAPMPPGIAAIVALGGIALYLDAFGLLSIGLYYRGFGPAGAPVLALAAAIACATAIARGRAVARAGTLLGAITLFAVLRLPTGNVWDALVDPLLWGWAVVTLGVEGWRWLMRAVRSSAPQAAPAGALQDSAVA